MNHEAYRELLQREPARRELAFEVEEYRRRLKRVRAEMDRAGLDAMLVTEPANVNYLAGYSTFETSVHVCLVVPREGEPVIQTPSIEVAPAVLTTHVARVLSYDWERPQTIGPQLSGELEALGLEEGALGLEDALPGLRPAIRSAIAGALPRARLVDASDLVHSVRVVKSRAELDHLREAARITRAGIGAALAEVAPGRRDSDVAAAAYEAMVRAGGEFPSMPAIVTSGARIGWIHTCFRRVPLRPGDAVFLELGGCYHRYTSPMMRTAQIGTPPAQTARVAGAAEDTLARLLSGIRPRRSCHDVAREAAAGLAPVADEVFFSGVYGYAVGAQFSPSWVEGSLYIAEGIERELEPGMVFHLPICYRVPGRTGVGLSETIAVTDTGCEILTETSRAPLTVVPDR